MLICLQSAERIKMGFILRQIEKTYRSVLFSRHDPDDRVFYFSKEDFPGLLSREYSFENKNGYLLRGNFYYYDNPRTDKIVIFDHGLAPWHKSYLCEIERICRHGYVVYTYDHTGCGDSEGEHIMGLCGSLSDLDDCISELESLEALADKDIMVVGHSRGGYATLNIPAFHPCIKKIVAMSGFVSLDVMLRQLAPFVPFVRKHIFEIERKQNPEYVDCHASDSISRSDVAAMIIHSADDKTVSAKANFLRLKEDLADRVNTEFLLMTDRDHNPTFTKSAVDYKHSFFKDLKRVKKNNTLVTDEDKSAFIASYDWKKMTEQDDEVWDKIVAFLDK